MPEAEVRALLAEHGFTVANMSYRITRDGPSFEYRMAIRTTNLATRLVSRPLWANWTSSANSASPR